MIKPQKAEVVLMFQLIAAGKEISYPFMTALHGEININITSHVKKLF